MSTYHDSHTLASLYNRVLARWHALGPVAAETLDAAAAALGADACRWVPLLLAGVVLGAPEVAPCVLLGSKEEASAYVQEYGKFWHTDTFNSLEPPSVGGTRMVPLAPPVRWLLHMAGIGELATETISGNTIVSLALNIGFGDSLWSAARPDVIDEMNVRLNSTSTSACTARADNPSTCPHVLRSHLLLLHVTAAMTANKPPIDAGGWQVWKPVAAVMEIEDAGGQGLATLKSRLRDIAAFVFDIAEKLTAKCRRWQQDEATAAELALNWSGELQHISRTLEELRPARIRWHWQAGQLRTARDLVGVLLEQQQALHASLWHHTGGSAAGANNGAGSSSSSSNGGGGDPDSTRRIHAAVLGGSFMEPPPVVLSLAAIQALQEFLNQQAVEVARHMLSSRGRAGSSSSGGGGSVTYPRIDVCAAAERLQRLVDAAFDAVGGEDLLAHALGLASEDLGGLPGSLRGAASLAQERSGSTKSRSSSSGGGSSSREDEWEDEDDDVDDEEEEEGGVTDETDRALDALAGLTALPPATARAQRQQQQEQRGEPNFIQVLRMGQRSGAPELNMLPGAYVFVEALLETHLNATLAGVTPGASSSGGDRALLLQELQEQLLQQQEPPVTQQQQQQQQQHDQPLPAAAAPTSTAGSGPNSSNGGSSRSTAHEELVHSGAPGAAAAGLPAPAPAAAEPHSSPAEAAARPAARPKVCSCCGGTFPKLLKCSKCHAVGVLVTYCSPECQRAAWPAHKPVCGKPPAVS